MEITAQGNYIRISPRKVHLVARVIRGTSAKNAQLKLKMINQRAARLIEDVLESALGNAKNKNAKIESLMIKAIETNKGPFIKRFRPASRGMAHEYKKRMSHVKVVLEEKV